MEATVEVGEELDWTSVARADGQPIEYLAPGGDRTLAGLVMDQPALKLYASVPRLDFLDVPDPNGSVLRKAAADVCAVRIQVADAPV